MSGPDKRSLVAVRVQIQQAHEHLLTACTILRTNGFPENADELMRSVKQVQVWTQRDGWLDCLARDPVSVSEAAE
jgi:hypothetical protein